MQNITAPTAGANIKFFNFGVERAGGELLRQRHEDDGDQLHELHAAERRHRRVCCTTGIESTTGTAYGAAGNGGLYYVDRAGAVHARRARSRRRRTRISPVAKVSTTLDNGKYYSYYIERHLRRDREEGGRVRRRRSDPGDDRLHAGVRRFVNASSNSQPMTLYAKNTTTGSEVAIGSTVAYKAAGTFQAVPGGVYDLNTRTAGSATNVITRTAVSFVAGRVYTVSSRGDMVSTVTANKPALDNTANR